MYSEIRHYLFNNCPLLIGWSTFNTDVTKRSAYAKKMLFQIFVQQPSFWNNSHSANSSCSGFPVAWRKLLFDELASNTHFGFSRWQVRLLFPCRCCATAWIGHLLWKYMDGRKSRLLTCNFYAEMYYFHILPNGHLSQTSVTVKKLMRKIMFLSLSLSHSLSLSLSLFLSPVSLPPFAFSRLFPCHDECIAFQTPYISNNRLPDEQPFHL